MKEKKNYLHYYIGRQFRLNGEAWETLTPKKYAEIIDDASIENIQLDLRLLSELKHTEINAIASIILGEETTCGKIDWSDDKEFCGAFWKKEEYPFGDKYDFVEMGMHISNIGNAFRIDHVWDYINSNVTGHTHEPLHNSHDLTHYLITRGFDVFGLMNTIDEN